MDRADIADVAVNTTGGEIKHGGSKSLIAADVAELVFGLMLGGPDVACRTGIDANGFAVHALKVLDAAVGPHAERLVAVVIRLRERNALEPFLGDRDRRRRHVDLAGLHGREKAVEGNIYNLDVHAQALSDLV